MLREVTVPQTDCPGAWIKKAGGSQVLNKRLLSFAILTTTSLCSNIVFAQDVAPTDAAGQPPAAADSSFVEEIIVTAEKRSERLRDVPMSVTAVTGSQLQDQGVAPRISRRLCQDSRLPKAPTVRLSILCAE